MKPCGLLLRRVFAEHFRDRHLARFLLALQPTHEIMAWSTLSIYLASPLECVAGASGASLKEESRTL